MKHILKISSIGLLIISLVSCKDSQSPNYQYFPNMYEAVGYETYSESDAFKNGQEAQLPPNGTLKRGADIYDLPNTTEGYNASKLVVTSPLDSTQVDMKKAGELYNVYCAICHGEKGDGQGNLVKREKLLGIPSYKDRQITVGSVYHVQMFGLNSMGSYANQLDAKERWMVSAYVMKLKSEL